MTSEVEFIVPKHIRIVDLVNELANRFFLKIEPTKFIDRTYFDSFDWRLYNKNLYLISEPVSVGFKLVLQSLNDLKFKHTLQVEKIPKFATEIRSNVFHTKLISILGVRALLPVLGVQYHCNKLKYIEDSGKTGIDISVFNPKLILPDGQIRLLGKRITLFSKKDNKQLAKKIRLFLRKTYSLPLANKDIFTLSLSMLEKKPNEFRNKSKILLHSCMPSGEAIVVLLRGLFRSIEINEEGTINDTDSEFLHDYRVAVRKTRTALSEIKPTKYKKEFEVYRSEFGWLGKITGPTRDMHVYLLRLQEYQQFLPKKKRHNLEPLHQYLKNIKENEHNILVTHLKSTRYNLLIQNWRKFLQIPYNVKEMEFGAEIPIKHIADARINKIFKRVIDHGSRIDENSSYLAIHKLRICCKKLRYLLEFFKKMYPRRKVDYLTKSLKNLQETLGDFNDCHLQLEFLKHINTDNKLPTNFQSQTKHAIELLVNILQVNERNLRKQINHSFITFRQEKHIIHRMRVY